MIPVPNRETVLAYLEYDQNTGVFIRRPRKDRGPTWNRRFANKEAGTLRPDNYVQMYVDGAVYLAHHLAWIYVHGAFPEHMEEMDHIDGDRTNNRISNLRPATVVQNRANSKPMKRKHRLPKGVKKRPVGYAASIYRNGKSKHIGSFKTPEEAHLAYSKEAVLASGEFARVA